MRRKERFTRRMAALELTDWYDKGVSWGREHPLREQPNNFEPYYFSPFDLWSAQCSASFRRGVDAGKVDRHQDLRDACDSECPPPLDPPKVILRSES